MYVESVTVQGFRAAANDPVTCRFPGRFAVVVGPNNSGKTTISEALYLGHVHNFPSLPRQTSALLGPNPRQIDIEFKFEDDPANEGSLGARLLAEASPAPSWTRLLERSLGSVRARGIETGAGQGHEVAYLMYLPAYRNPVDELARREAQVLVELLRTEQERLNNHRNLADLRALTTALLEGLNEHDLIQSVERRIQVHLSALSSGVEPQFPFMGRTVVDASFLARVLELLLASIDSRVAAGRLELSGLGYANLLHIAVILAAIPGEDPLPGVTAVEPGAEPGPDQRAAGEPPVDQASAYPEVEFADGEVLPGVPLGPDLLAEATDEAEAREDSLFSTPQVHVTVVIEEPEAHLHPQLQHGLTRYLQQIVRTRPEIQVILTTHSSDVVTACDPADVVVMRREVDGSRVCRLLKELPLEEPTRTRVLRMTALHFDAARSAAFMAERVVLVEGITDVLLLRVMGRAWAGTDQRRRNQVDALSIVPIGNKIGQWPVDLLATPGHELVQRVALLMDSDNRTDATPTPAMWLDDFDEERVRPFINHPTLEPAVTPGNETHIQSVLDVMTIAPPAPVTAAVIDTLMHGNSRKGEFAYNLAAHLDDVVATGGAVQVPPHMSALFEFLFPAEPVQAVGAD